MTQRNGGGRDRDDGGNIEIEMAETEMMKTEMMKTDDRDREEGGDS